MGMIPFGAQGIEDGDSCLGKVRGVRTAAWMVRTKGLNAKFRCRFVVESKEVEISFVFSKQAFLLKFHLRPCVRHVKMLTNGSNGRFKFFQILIVVDTAIRFDATKIGDSV